MVNTLYLCWCFLIHSLHDRDERLVRKGVRSENKNCKLCWWTGVLVPQGIFFSQLFKMQRCPKSICLFLPQRDQHISHKCVMPFYTYANNILMRWTRWPYLDGSIKLHLNRGLFIESGSNRVGRLLFMFSLKCFFFLPLPAMPLDRVLLTVSTVAQHPLPSHVHHLRLKVVLSSSPRLVMMVILIRQPKGQRLLPLSCPQSRAEKHPAGKHW